MADEGGGINQDDISFLRTEDGIMFNCTAPSVSGQEGGRVCLAAEGFGNRMCFLQSMANKDLPFDMSVCVFVLEQALSVRALQEMVSARSNETAGQSGHRTLLYGHAVMLRHSHSNMYLSCLSTQSSSSDKLAFDVGLMEAPEGESCWWTIHPASKQRSEGEKVRVGDDLILVSVASERYLHIGAGSMVIASFQQTLWAVQPISSGAVRLKSLGYVFGGDVLRILHGDECLTIPHRDADDVLSNAVMYETGTVQCHARSLWKLEHVKLKWSEGFMGWSQPCRLRHVTSGRYLAVTEDNQIVVYHRSIATEESTSFLLRQSKDDRKFSEGSEDEGMGTSDISYGDTVVYLQHIKSGNWLSYQTFETKKRGVGRVEMKKAVALVEGHMDDGLTFSKAQVEEDKSARVIRKCTSLISRFIKALESLKSEGRTSHQWENISLAEVIKTLEDLIEYFAPPSDQLEFEERQNRLKALRNRQDLFQEEGMIALILETIDHCSQWKSMRALAHLIGEDSASKWNDMISYLYLLLAAMIRGNRANCSDFASSSRLDWLVDRLDTQEASTAALIKGNRSNCAEFASASRLDWLIHRLESQESPKGVLDVLHCVLIDSPEALNVIKEQHIRTIISLIDKHGRDPKVLNVLCSLCVGNDVAVRSNQNLICDNLLPGRDLLLQTKVVEHVFSMKPNIYVGRREGAAMYLKWYFEAIIDSTESVGGMPAQIRVGWGNTDGFVPYPGGGYGWGANGVGDDLFSYGFDGCNLWTGGKPRSVRLTQHQFVRGDVIGVLIDLTVPQISFTVNGMQVKGFFRDFNLDGMFFPVVSMSAKASVRYILGGEHGKLKYGPPEEYSAAYECLRPKQKLRIEPCFFLGELTKGLINGPYEIKDVAPFLPCPVDTTEVQLPQYVENIREKLAENIHEQWAMGKIEQGCSYGEHHDDHRKIHPCLINFERLPTAEKQYNHDLAQETLRTLVALGYHISYDPQYTSNTRLKTLKLSNNYLQSNGYKPMPLDLSGVKLNEKMKELVETLAENTHNVWARGRIKNGWTYGLNEDPYSKRIPHLVPYSKVDNVIKKSNREMASETVRTLMAYGYSLEPPSSEGSETMAKELGEKKTPARTYRGEYTYAVTSGKWYYEFEVITTGYMKVGFAKLCLEPGLELGMDSSSYAFEGQMGRKWHQGPETYGKLWQRGDVIGCMIDMTDKTISFSLNGELMMDTMGQEIAFKGISLDEPYVPAITLGAGQHAKVSFGQDVNSLKFFTCCGLQEGYEPFCVNMTRHMTMWYGREQALFNQLTKDHPRVEVTKVAAGSNTPPSLKLNSKTYGTLERTCLEFVRLSLPVSFHRQFVSPRDKAAAVDMRTALQMKNSGEAVKEKRHFFKKKDGKLTRSMDDSSLDNVNKQPGMKRQTSETNLAAEFLGVTEKAKTGSKSSLLDRFSDASKTIGDKHKKKNPLSIFKKSKSRDPSPLTRVLPTKTSATISEYDYTESEGSYDESMAHEHLMPPGAHKMKTVSSHASYLSELDTEEYTELEANMSIIDEFYYGIRVFPGQDPNQVFVGWVTPQFHEHNAEFDMKKIRNVVVCTLNQDYQLKSSVSRKNCYIVSAGDLQNRYGHQEEQGKRMTPGLLIGCQCDTSTGVLSFTVNGNEVANKFQVEPGTMLFPAVFFEPTNKEVLQFELGRTKTSLPLSAALFRSGKHIVPQCPPRLDLQVLQPISWSRVPMASMKVHTLKMSEIRGWSMLCDESVPMMAIHIPEEDRCLDILELIEHPDLLNFHAHTLSLYRSVCSHGNHRVAHELIKHIDQDQMKYCIKSKYLSGPLRLGMHDLLISIHLESHANSRLATRNEYIIALDFDSSDFSLFNEEQAVTANGEDPHIRSFVPSLDKSVSIRPKVNIDEWKTQSKTTPTQVSPFFPLALLKRDMMAQLTDAVRKGAAHIRDPIGGSNECLFVPLIKVVDSLMVMGVLNDNDLNNLLCLIDPSSFDPYFSPGSNKYGLLTLKLAEPVKYELCKLLHHLTDSQRRHRVESLIAFSDGFVETCQKEQLLRYNTIKQADLPMAEAARKTREFRCPPQEQMRTLLAFKKEHNDLARSHGHMVSPCGGEVKQRFEDYHQLMLKHCDHPLPVVEQGAEEDAPQQKQLSWGQKMLAWLLQKEDAKEESDSDPRPKTFQQLIIKTVIQWAKVDFIHNQNLVREMFSLLHRQYEGAGELVTALEQSYVISNASKDDINSLLQSLGVVRSLLPVQVGEDEEELLKTSIWDLADNKVFFQHPDLMRALGIHNTVMQLMVSTLTRQQQQSAAIEMAGEKPTHRNSLIPGDEINVSGEQGKDSIADMVVACCRFLCYFCRTGSRNQSALFEHLGYLLDKSCMLLSRPSLRGACPLDVAYSSLMDNNELALALRESDLDKVAIYLSRCGQQSNQELMAKGYPDIGWDPVEGERFIDFLRFCVWVNGESVEENANLVVRLLIRRPECLGPALRGEGGGLLKAMQMGITMSLQIRASRDRDSLRFLRAVTETEDDDMSDILRSSKYDYSMLPLEDDEDYLDMGDAILAFYSSLVDLLGRCAPDAETIKAGRSDSIRARAILRSLVTMEDLEGVCGLRFILPIGKPEQVMRDDGIMETVMVATMPPGLQPQHKGAIVQFLERVYGIEDQMTFFRLLEQGFLPDMRAATTLEAAGTSESDMALALNRYICTSVLPLLTKYSHFFQDADHASELLEKTLHTTYRLSKCKSLTKNQRDNVSDFLLSFTSQLRPPMMTTLLRKLVVDVPALTENTVVPLRVLTNHYERCGYYYGSGGSGGHGSATEEERRLTMMLFSGIFDSLAQRAYDPELFSKALPCLSAIGCALSPDYSLSSHSEDIRRYTAEADETYTPNPVKTNKIHLTDQFAQMCREFAEHSHDEWALSKIENNWVLGQVYDEDKKQHPNLKSFKSLSEKEKGHILDPLQESVKAMLAWGWTVEVDTTRQTSKSLSKRKMSKVALGDYMPKPVDMRSVNLTRTMLEMSERIAENAHEVWALRKRAELDSIGGGIHTQLVPYHILTDKERNTQRERAKQLLRYFQHSGYRVVGDPRVNKNREAFALQNRESETDSGVGVSAVEKRFAYSLLEKLLEYVDKASYNMKNTKPGTRYSRRHSFSTATEDVKFFGKVVLPLVERYFKAHKDYFITNPNMPSDTGTASLKEKEMTTSLFSKLSLLLRQRITAFGHDVQISVRCMQTLVQAIDARAVAKNSPEIIRSSLLPFFNYAADDLTQTVANLKIGRFSHVKGTVTRGATSLNYVHMVLLPVLTSMFDHLGRNSFGSDLLVGEQQLACYRILNALYALGTNSKIFVQRESVMIELGRHRPALGECVASFASTFPVAFLEPQLNKFNKNSILFGIEEDRIAAHSLEAKEVMDEIAENVPPLEKIVAEIEGLAVSGGKYNEAPHVIEVTLPMLCSYLPFWWSQGPDSSEVPTQEGEVTKVTANLMNNVLGNVLQLIGNNIGTPDAPWMNRIASRTQPIIRNATATMLRDHIIPVGEKLRQEAHHADAVEEHYLQEKRKAAAGDTGDAENNVKEILQVLVRDMYAFYPLLIKYVDLHRSTWLKATSTDAEKLYECVADVFNLWSKSHLFKKEEQNFVFANEIDNMALIMPSQDKHSAQANLQEGQGKGKSRKERVKHKMEITQSLNVACLRRLLPIGLNMFGGKEQELVQQAKQRLIEMFEGPILKESEGDIEDWLKISFQTEDKDGDDESHQWQKMLYKKIGSKKGEGEEGSPRFNLTHTVSRVLAMAKVLHGLHMVEHPPASMLGCWKKVLSSQRKRAVMACFRMTPLHHMPRHRAINLFLKSYKDQWLKREEPGHGILIEDITGTKEFGEEVPEEDGEEGIVGPHPLAQLITAFSRSATIDPLDVLISDSLYNQYAFIMSQSCHGGDDDEEDEEGGGEEGDASVSFQEQEIEKQKLLFEQARLSDRGAAEMVLMYISASKGQFCDMVMSTLDLGISILKGGNTDIQKKMLEHLKEKKDVGFFTSVAELMQQCSVLDLDAFERQNKAEGLGVTDGSTQMKNLSDEEEICKLFRFLQLLCEGHNLDFQNYLRTQAGNTTTVNVIICTVDYLLRLQESIMDFYWHYSGQDSIDEAGKGSFFRAIKVAGQVFASITEFIQGPCTGNQLALAHSRLWDAVGGFLYLFAHMQDKLSKDPEQLELLRQFMRLQKDMMIMMLSMLEGNVVNGPIGKQMVDTLVESSANFEMILKFFDIFLKMKDLSSSDAFMEFDINKDGVISHKEFRRAMESQKIYTPEEIEYIMMCVDANQDGKVDFNEFTDRFHNPAKDIGFNVAVLLTNLSEHMPNDTRLERFMEKARSVLDYFEPYLGRIEIMGGEGKIERVYFEIKQSNIDQWEKPQIKESKRAFLHDIVNEEGEKGKLDSFINFCEDTIFEDSKRAFLFDVVNEEGDKEKMEAFINFCEDTIFEMQHATSISAEEQSLHMAAYGPSRQTSDEAQGGVLELVKSGVGSLRDGFWCLLSCLHPSYIKQKYLEVRDMTWKERGLGLGRVSLSFLLVMLQFLFTVCWTMLRFVYMMMRGDSRLERTRLRLAGDSSGGSIADRRLSYISPDMVPEEQVQKAGGTMEAFGLDITREEGEDGQVKYKMSPHKKEESSGEELSGEEVELSGDDQLDSKMIGGEGRGKSGKSALDGPASSGAMFDEMESEVAQLQKEPALEIEQKGMDFGKWVLSLCARNFYNFKLIALAMAFTINFILLFFKVSQVEGTETVEDIGESLADTLNSNSSLGENGVGAEAEEEDIEEWVSIPDNIQYLAHFLRFLSVSHAFVAFAMMVAYYCLKVPLVVFKREKEIARSLEFDGMWIAEQPADDDIRGHWDKLVISTRSFPDKYWDKFVKKKVRVRYSEQYDFDQICNLLGMDKTESLKVKERKSTILPDFLANIDWQYEVWKWGIIVTDNSFLYCMWYFLMSVLGNLNPFFYAAHLLDVTVCVKALGTITQSVTHNGKQLVLTVMLTSIVVYVYTVIAFNFFRKFYSNEGEEGEMDYKCHDMATCFVFHLYKGVRAGGGIGDEIEPADGDPSEVYRIIFDITFFFFVIVILLAIIQGLIIDAFGELRGQLEQVKEDLESSCFICTIGKDYFDKIPHGFETHVKNEHNFANYMFFLMHLINKPDTEYTGQETYVWNLYQQRCWDFIPVGECFRKQYEEELMSKSS